MKDDKDLLAIGIARSNFEQMEKGNPALLLGKSINLDTNIIVTFGAEGAEATIGFMTESHSTLCVFITPEIRRKLLAGEYVVTEYNDFGFKMFLFFAETNEDLVAIVRKIGFLGEGAQLTFDKSILPSDRPINPN